MLRPYSLINFAKNADLETVVKDFKFQIRISCRGIKEQIERMGKFLKENNLVKESDICIEIKNYLKEEIEEQLISERTIDRCCPDSWKRKTKPKRERQMSFFSFKDDTEEQTLMNTNNDVISKGQILQQEFRAKNHQLMPSVNSLHRHIGDINKLNNLEEEKWEVWTGKGSVKYGDIQLDLIITVNSKLKKIEKVALDLNEYYLNDKET